MGTLASRFIGLVMGLISVPSMAADGVIRADEAFAAARRGEVLIIDVRTPAEWRQTGIPEGAKAADVSSAAGIEAFAVAVTRVVGGDLGKPVALICRSGNRSTQAAETLRAHGFSNVLNIKEGMSGSGDGPGWLRRGLPVVACPDC